MPDHERRRRRLRTGNSPAVGRRESADADPQVMTTGIDDRDPATGRRVRSGEPAEDRESERGLRGLIGAGSSQVRTGAALRARDAARPTEADLAEAHERLVVVRRNWSPPDRQTRPSY